MAWFQHQPDPFSKKTRDLNRQLRNVKAEIQQLSLELDDEKEHPALTVTKEAATSDQSGTTGRQPFLDAVRQTFKRLMGMIQSRSPESERLVSYLAAGSFEGMRPLRYEKRVRRNRIIFYSLVIAILIFAVMGLL